jgi:hypothetical protein
MSATAPSDYDAILQEAEHLHRLGVEIITVIPVELPAAEYPSRKDRAKPAFTGKNPSQWTVQGEPLLLSHGKVPAFEEVIEAVEIARDLGKPIGLAIVPGESLVVIDFDLKDYGGDPDALANDVFRLLDEHPELRQTRIEQTPGGGIHVYVRATDRMASWSYGSGSRRCLFTTTAGGPHRGEVLSGTRISVTAPTRNGRGPYEVIHQDHAYDVVEVPNLATIGIFPVAGTAPPDGAGAIQAELQRPQVRLQEGQSIPRLEELLGRKAQEVLRGGLPYGEDRSSNLAGFLKELYGWVNLLTAEDLPCDGSPDQLIAAAVAALKINDKAERVAAGIHPSTCTHRDPEGALARYRRHAAGQRHRGEGAAEGLGVAEPQGVLISPAGPAGMQAPPMADTHPLPSATTYSQLITSILEAIRSGTEDDEMELRAELKNRFRLSDEKVEAALFKAYSAEKVQRKPATGEGVNMAMVKPLTYLMDGWILRGDVVLTYGAYGTGKTTLALAKAHAHITGRNLLDRDAPCQPGKVLFIATDSGVAPLRKAMEDLGLDPETDPLLMDGHPDQRLWVWGHEPEQGQDKWSCTIRDIIRLEQFILRKGISYVVIDSAKSVSSVAGWSYTSNESVKALLGYIREGLAQPTGACVEFLSHDGTGVNLNAGAKSWAEEPSMVCHLTTVGEGDGQVVGIKAQFRKDRAATVDPRRSMTYHLRDGELVLEHGGEVVGNCGDAILTILWDAHRNGLESMSTAEVQEAAMRRFQRSRKTVENTLGAIAGSGKGPNPSKVIKPRRGRYALAPAERQRREAAEVPPDEKQLPYRAPCQSGGEGIKSIGMTEKNKPPIEPPDGGTGGNANPRPNPRGELIGGYQNPVPASDLGLTPPDEGTWGGAESVHPAFLPGEDDPHWPPRREAA